VVSLTTARKFTPSTRSKGYGGLAGAIRGGAHEAELEADGPKKSKTIEIEEFVDMDQIDPVYFARQYYMCRREWGEGRIALLVEAMEKKAKRFGVARFRDVATRNTSAAPASQVRRLIMETRHVNDEVIPGTSGVFLCFIFVFFCFVCFFAGVPHKPRATSAS